MTQHGQLTLPKRNGTQNNTNYSHKPPKIYSSSYKQNIQYHTLLPYSTSLFHYRRHILLCDSTCQQAILSAFLPSNHRPQAPRGRIGSIQRPMASQPPTLHRPGPTPPQKVPTFMLWPVKVAPPDKLGTNFKCEWQHINRSRHRNGIGRWHTIKPTPPSCSPA